MRCIDQACFARALPVVTVYATLGDDALCYALDLTETEVMIADAALLKNIVSIMNGVNIMDGSEERHASIRGLKTVVTFTTPDAKFVEQLSKRSEEHGGPIAVMSLDEVCTSLEMNRTPAQMVCPRRASVVLYFAPVLA